MYSSQENNAEFHFHSSCVCWERSDVDNLSKMIDESSDITRATFLKHVDKDFMNEWERSAGYAIGREKGLRMANDFAVSYHKSKLHGQKVYYFRHSAIEHVFVKADHEFPETIY